MEKITEVKEIREIENVVEANKLIETGEWILLKIFMDTQLCFNKVTLKEGFTKIQPFDKLIKIYVIGRIK